MTLATKRGTRLATVFRWVLACAAVGHATLLSAPVFGEDSSQAVIRFDPGDADFKGWVGHFQREIYKRWPPAAVAGLQGRADMEFTVARDGKVGHIRVKTYTGSVLVQRSAGEALKASNLLPLPSDFRHETVTMRVSFYVNERPDSSAPSEGAR